jgi:two-component system, OmpR family, phosphate regulon sensor histidine kinase PhoR
MLGVWILVAVPALLVLTCAVLILVYHQTTFDVIMGVFLVVLCVAIGAGAALTITGIWKDRKLAALQIDFVSKVSHELKTPLTSIRMFTETLMLGRVNEPEKIDNCLLVISKETDRLSLLIGRLLSWGRMEAGAFAIEPTSQVTEELVTAAVRTFDAQAQAAKKVVNVSIEEELPNIEADSQALTDAILNLLSNAVRYSPDSKEIWLSVKKHGAKFVDIVVRDEGMGIELKEQSRIFERFYSADERVSRTTGGTGLGLAIAKHIVTAHQGTITVQSEPEKGSTFIIRLPVGSAEA